MDMTKSVKFDSFLPEVLKTRIARLARLSHMPGFPVGSHICDRIWENSRNARF